MVSLCLLSVCFRDLSTDENRVLKSPLLLCKGCRICPIDYLLSNGQPTAHIPTCTALADDDAEVDGGPVRLGSPTVGTEPVGGCSPDALGHL